MAVRRGAEIPLRTVAGSSNKKLALGTYESALSDLAKAEDKKDALQVLARVVALEPVQANFSAGRRVVGRSW